MTNSLGTFLQEQLRVLGWSRAMVAVTIDGVACRALCLSTREIVLRTAEGSGLSVLGGIEHTEAVLLATNDELMREVRRRLALGARTGQYLTSAPQHRGVDTGAKPA